MKSPSNLYFNPNFNSNFNLYLNQNHNLNPYQYQLRHKLDKRIESIEVDFGVRKIRKTELGGSPYVECLQYQSCLFSNFNGPRS